MKDAWKGIAIGAVWAAVVGVSFFAREHAGNAVLGGFFATIFIAGAAQEKGEI